MAVLGKTQTVRDGSEFEIRCRILATQHSVQKIFAPDSLSLTQFPGSKLLYGTGNPEKLVLQLPVLGFNVWSNKTGHILSLKKVNCERKFPSRLTSVFVHGVVNYNMHVSIIMLFSIYCGSQIA